MLIRIFFYILDCHATLTELHGEITSFGFPTGYYNFMDCTWLIQRFHREVIEITISHFDLDPDVGLKICRYITFARLLKYFRYVKKTFAWNSSRDSLTIYDGGSKSSDQIGKFCGNSLPPNKIISLSYQLLLLFETDIAGTFLGFKISYNTLCKF